MNKATIAIQTAAVAVAVLGISAGQASAHDGHDGVPTTTKPAAAARSSAKPLFLTAKLSGGNEVPAANGKAVDDPDGRATAIVRVKGSRVTFALDWSGITAPTLGHLHEGAKGVNGPVQVDLFETPVPDTATAVAGAVTVDDPAIADRIRANPAGFYLNLHTAQFPGGAVRGQLVPLGHSAGLLGLLDGGGLRAALSGDDEVPVAGGPAVGDPDGRAVGFVRADAGQVRYALAWTGVSPTLGHIHRGVAGANGPVVVPLFATAVPSTIVAIAGTVPGVDPQLVTGLRHDPGSFYLNLHTADFPGGAVRGQLR